MGECNILLVYVPAGCTDLHKVCGVVVNKPYKNGVIKAFVDYVSEKFLEFTNRANPEAADVFQLSMAGSKCHETIDSSIRCKRFGSNRYTIDERGPQGIILQG